MTDLATRPEVDEQTRLELEAAAAQAEAEARAEAEAEADAKDRLRVPGGKGGLIEVYRTRVIVKMLVRKDVRLKYRYSSIGYAWTYVRPIFQFCIYFFFVGMVLELDRRVSNFAIYIFSGLSLLHLFQDTLSSCTKSILKNRAIVKKIWLPREIFPVAALISAMNRFVPMFIIMMIGCTLTGWYFTWEGLAAAICGFVLMMVWALAAGLIVASCNVYLREIQNFMGFVGFVIHWTTPMLKPWTLVVNRVSDLGTFGLVVGFIYIYNPLCTALELFHLAFWAPTVDFYLVLSPNLWERTAAFFGLGLLFLAFGQWVFSRLQTHFVEEL